MACPWALGFLTTWRPGSRASDLRRHVVCCELALEVRQVTFAMFCSLQDSQQPSQVRGSGGINGRGARFWKAVLLWVHIHSAKPGTAWKTQGRSCWSLKCKVNRQDLCSCVHFIPMTPVPPWSLWTRRIPLDRAEFFSRLVEIHKPVLYQLSLLR